MSRTIKKEIRHENILLSLDKLGYMNRSQLQRIHDLKSDRNALKVMKELSEYVSVFHYGENIYHLNKNGRDRIDSKKVRKKTNQVTHFLMRNEVYILYGCPKQWALEQPVEIPGVIKVVPDATFILGDRWFFVEVDNKQSLQKNRDKIARYKKMKETQAFQTQYGYFPKLIWMAATEARKRKLKTLCEGLDCEFYSVEEV